jgi:hypothetical protein
MPNRKAKLRKQDRAKKNAAIKKFKRNKVTMELKPFKRDDGSTYEKRVPKERVIEAESLELDSESNGWNK